MVKNTTVRVVLLASCLVLLQASLLLGASRAEWNPGSNELAPTGDTYLSVAGTLGDPTANYGAANTLSVGEGINGDCVGVISFDLSTLPANVNSLNFTSDITVYGDATRTLEVFVILDSTWNELTVTNATNPFNAVQVWAAAPGSANCTSLTIASSTSTITFSVFNWRTASTITLLFKLPTAVSWITMAQKESQYLYSFSNPPHLVYSTTPEETGGTTTPYSGDIPGAPLLAVIVTMGLAALLVGLRKRKIAA